jgi:hypothetical protein
MNKVFQLVMNNENVAGYWLLVAGSFGLRFSQKYTFASIIYLILPFSILHLLRSGKARRI